MRCAHLYILFYILLYILSPWTARAVHEFGPKYVCRTVEKTGRLIPNDPNPLRDLSPHQSISRHVEALPFHLCVCVFVSLASFSRKGYTHVLHAHARTHECTCAHVQRACMHLVYLICRMSVYLNVICQCISMPHVT